MKKEVIETLDFKNFVSLFMQREDMGFTYDNSPIQIYPLHYAKIFIKPPSPLFKLEYSVLLIFSTGGGVQQIDNEIYQIKQNQVLFIREGHLNSIKSIHPETSGYFVYIDFKVLSRVISDNNQLRRITYNPQHSLRSEDGLWIAKCCDLMMEIKGQSPNSLEIKTTLLKSIFLKLIEGWDYKLSVIDRKMELALLFKEVLFKNFKEHRNVEFYADSLAISKNYLNRILKSLTNKSVKQHINEIIIYNSQILLQASSTTISQVAFDLNFNDPSHFGRVFKQVTKMSPSEYQKSIMHNLSE